MEGLIELISQMRRPNLGEDVPVMVFRAFRVYVGMYLEETVGQKGAITLIQNAGRELGKTVGAKLMDGDLQKYLGKVIDFVRDARIGILIPADLGEDKLKVGAYETKCNANGDNICEVVVELNYA